ncbi:MAG: peptidoglycan-binding domain-containing protein [Alphaproteobacteria bacterium]
MIFDLLRNISGSVGRTGDNNKADVAGIEAALGSQGYLDLGKTDGPTGYFGTFMEEAVKKFQKANGLKVDGVITPGGETIGQLAQKAGQDGGTKPKHPDGKTPPSDNDKIDSDPPSPAQRIFGPPAGLLQQYFPKRAIKPNTNWTPPGGTRG